ncbi:hypothetical protein BBD42_15385 [Paenibacillus sp. BIHB 4019]|uniref:Uncharacterized protein n=1 Tax=Paenibacillus sp. BIHB 4019 TaxID=1870819 RepID=A0A1B2DIZ4_9BACL|nr:hypothetical protein [Paenibacillus sp. BIHB 4019]ANY67694.1 hypothetical protein BBD42_15385 [Paenibacillus sp. BIHB 4019]
MNRFNSKLNRINRASNKALAQFTSTMRSLIRQNEKLDAVIDESDAEINALEETRNLAVIARNENRAVIKWIDALVNGSVAE